jgi:hypothetical protein
MRGVLPSLAWAIVGCGGPTLVAAPMSATAPQPAISASPDGPPAPQAPPTAALGTTSRAVPSAAALAARIESFYASAAPFECDFDVETRTRLSDDAQKSRLHVTFARPGRFRIPLPNGTVLLVDAQRETVFHPTSQRARQRAVATDHCPIALSYAASPGSLGRHLALRSYSGATMNAPGLDILVGTAPAGSPSLDKLVFYADETGLVKRALFLLPTGGRQRYDLVACTMHVNAPASLFALALPAMPATGTLPAPPLLTEPLP